MWYDFGKDGEGHEQRGKRPAIVLSCERYNAYGLCLIVAVTTKVKGYPFEVAIPKDSCSVSGCILSDQVRTIDWVHRNATFNDDDCVPLETMDIVSGMINSIIDF